MKVQYLTNEVAVAFFQKLRSLFRGGAGTDDAHVLIFYVRCNRCGEVIRVRADRRWDLLQELGDGAAGYSLHKDVLGTQCNALMRMLVLFDGTYRITHQEIEGGRFVTPAEYEAFQRSSDQGAPGRA
jgi:hypothetical protein